LLHAAAGRFVEIGAAGALDLCTCPSLESDAQRGADL
jgi:hypothetical protein